MRILWTEVCDGSLSQVLRTEEMGVRLVLSIMSHIVCISATLYGAVESLEVSESTICQLIKTVKELTDHQCRYSIEHRVAL